MGMAASGRISMLARVTAEFCVRSVLAELGGQLPREFALVRPRSEPEARWWTVIVVGAVSGRWLRGVVRRTLRLPR
jgi:hypothetical protein